MLRYERTKCYFFPPQGGIRSQITCMKKENLNECESNILVRYISFTGSLVNNKKEKEQCNLICCKYSKLSAVSMVTDSNRLPPTSLFSCF